MGADDSLNAFQMTGAETVSLDSEDLDDPQSHNHSGPVIIQHFDVNGCPQRLMFSNEFMDAFASMSVEECKALFRKERLE